MTKFRQVLLLGRKLNADAPAAVASPGVTDGALGAGSVDLSRATVHGLTWKSTPRRCPRRAARVYRGGEPSGDPSAFGLVTHIVSLPFEAIGQLWDKFVIEIARLVIFATALGAVFALGPSLLAFARPWLTVQVLWYAAYVVTARVRLGVPAALLLPPLARSLAASVLCALPALLVVRLFGADRVGGVRAAGTATLLVAAALWRTPPLVDARDAVARVLEVWRRPATFAGDAPVKAAAPIEP